MKTVAAFFLAILASGVSAEELPDLVPLSSGNFGKRQASQKAVNDWVIANHEVAREVLLKKYLKTDNPELRVRLIPANYRSGGLPATRIGRSLSPTSSKLFAYASHGEVFENFYTC